MGARAGELAAVAVAVLERPGRRVCISVEQWGGRGRQMLPFSSLQQESVDKIGWGSRNTRPPVSLSLGYV